MRIQYQIKGITCLFLMLIMLVILIFPMYLYYLHNTNKWTLLSAQKAVSTINSILDYGEQANVIALSYKGLPCDRVSLNLRHEVTSIPYVRSVNLAKDNLIYCTSLFGESTFQDTPSDYVNHKLLLMPGNRVKKNHPLIVVRTSNGDTAALSGIDGLYIQTLLSQQEDDKLLLYIRVHNKWLSEGGSFLKNPSVNSLFALKSFTSPKYPFSVYAGLDFGSSLSAFLNQNKVYLFFVAIISLVLPTFMWWQLTRPISFDRELTRALKNNEFIPYAQPIVDAFHRHVIGIEILMRWHHPVHGIIRPDLFIPQAEESGLIIPMTKNLFISTAKLLNQFSLPSKFHVSINITAMHCNGMQLLYDCQEFLAMVNNSNIKLVLELTERQKLDNTPHIASLFSTLNNLGVTLAIDDFGTGHSSLSYLNEFNVKTLKIDLSFVSQIGKNSLSEHLIDNVIDLGKRLNMSMIAEGVETNEQAEFLKSREVSYLQGYLFGKPEPLSEWLLSYKNEYLK
ncbi:cyclic diguanylate phosphodiesterase [Aeromonas sp. CU5]|uniref:EAL domain-containing protein n=1 Tax=Aeromonas sp. CU5 TaxID=2033033 RepID=UPI000BFD81C6|nr:EAL domain-containing protein [Aeromonas sp. CU5]ATL91573.1 cyclic diguanylate phosphodiesterase [Aeromonas sp. CU5]